MWSLVGPLQLVRFLVRALTRKKRRRPPSPTAPNIWQRRCKQSVCMARARPSPIGPSASVLPASTPLAAAAATPARPTVVVIGEPTVTSHLVHVDSQLEAPQEPILQLHSVSMRYEPLGDRRPQAGQEILLQPGMQSQALVAKTRERSSSTAANQSPPPHCCLASQRLGLAQAVRE